MFPSLLGSLAGDAEPRGDLGPGVTVGAPHPIAAGNRPEGGTVMGGACAIALAMRPQGSALDRPALKGYTIGSR
jgi:hypothetical protein